MSRSVFLEFFLSLLLLYWVYKTYSLDCRMNDQVIHTLKRVEKVIDDVKDSTLVLGKVYTLEGGKQGVYMYKFINIPDKYVFGLVHASAINAYLQSKTDFVESNAWVKCSINKIVRVDADQKLEQNPDDPDFKACVEEFASLDKFYGRNSAKNLSRL
jgi:hypothetical protein